VKHSLPPQSRQLTGELCCKLGALRFTQDPQLQKYCLLSPPSWAHHPRFLQQGTFTAAARLQAQRLQVPPLPYAAVEQLDHRGVDRLTQGEVGEASTGDVR